jgi:hypothetical protein
VKRTLAVANFLPRRLQITQNLAGLMQKSPANHAHGREFKGDIFDSPEKSAFHSSAILSQNGYFIRPIRAHSRGTEFSG